MQSFKKELQRLNRIVSFIEKDFGYLGINKKQELTRLIFEISKKEMLPPERLFGKLPPGNFDTIKRYLVRRRYPSASIGNEITNLYLPKIKLDEKAVFHIENKPFYPKEIFIEHLAMDSVITQRFKNAFPEGRIKEISSLKEYLKNNKRTFTLEDYNKRRDTIFIVNEKYDFFKKCPCTKNAIGCGYHIFNLSFGCIFDCTYCYLQRYTDTPGLIFPANLKDFFERFHSYKKPRMRLGTGEFSDSLMLDNITEYSLEIIDFFKKYPDIRFEFKTKSTNIENLLKANHAGNIVVAWTFNPQRIIDENEFYTPTLIERLEAVKKCVRAGYKVSCHFDPVIYFKGWQKEYKNVIEMLFDTIRPSDIAWLSIGTLRFNPELKQVIETRFPGNKILDEELVYGFDNKLRYPRNIRIEIYSFILKILKRYSKNLPVYLCMEDLTMWRDIGLKPGNIFR